MGYESQPAVPEEPKDVEWGPNVEHLTSNKSDHSHLIPLVGQVVETHDAYPIVTSPDDGYFHRTTATVNDNIVMCGSLSVRSVNREKRKMQSRIKYVKFQKYRQFVVKKVIKKKY